MNFWELLLGSAESDAHFEETRKDFFDDYSFAERVWMDYCDSLNYVDNLAGFAQRTTWETPDGVLHWQDTVIDQFGNEWLIDEGNHYVGPSMWDDAVYAIEHSCVF